MTMEVDQIADLKIKRWFYLDPSRFDLQFLHLELCNSSNYFTDLVDVSMETQYLSRNKFMLSWQLIEEFYENTEHAAILILDY